MAGKLHCDSGSMTWCEAVTSIRTSFWRAGTSSWCLDKKAKTLPDSTRRAEEEKHGGQSRYRAGLQRLSRNLETPRNVVLPHRGPDHHDRHRPRVSLADCLRIDGHTSRRGIQIGRAS